MKPYEERKARERMLAGKRLDRGARRHQGAAAVMSLVTRRGSTGTTRMYTSETSWSACPRKQPAGLGNCCRIVGAGSAIHTWQMTRSS